MTTILVGQKQIKIENAEEYLLKTLELLLECRDALPAITLVAAKMRGIDLKLADRVEDHMEPFRDKD